MGCIGYDLYFTQRLTGRSGILYLAADRYLESFNILVVLLVVLIYTAGSTLSKISFLMVLAVLLSSSVISVMTGYGYASYSFLSKIQSQRLSCMVWWKPAYTSYLKEFQLFMKRLL